MAELCGFVNAKSAWETCLLEAGHESKRHRYRVTAKPAPRARHDPEAPPQEIDPEWLGLDMATRRTITAVCATLDRIHVGRLVDEVMAIVPHADEETVLKVIRDIRAGSW